MATKWILADLGDFIAGKLGGKVKNDPGSSFTDAVSFDRNIDDGELAKVIRAYFACGPTVLTLERFSDADLTGMVRKGNALVQFVVTNHMMDVKIMIQPI